MKTFDKILLYALVVYMVGNFFATIHSEKLTYDTITRNDKIMLDGAYTMDTMTFHAAIKMDEIYYDKVQKELAKRDSIIETLLERVSYK